MRHVFNIVKYQPELLEAICDESMLNPITGARYMHESSSGKPFYMIAMANDELLIVGLGNNAIPSELLFVILSSCGSENPFSSMTEKRGARRIYSGAPAFWRFRVSKYPFCATRFSNERCTQCHSYLKVVKPHEVIKGEIK